MCYQYALVIFALFLLYIFKLYWNKVHYWQRIHVTNPRGHWIFGNLNGIQKGRSINDIFSNYYRQYRGTGVPFVGLYVFITPHLLVVDWQLAKRILTVNFAHFRNRGLYANSEDLSSNLFTLDYGKWKELRRKVSPVFTNARLKLMFSKFTHEAKELVQTLHKSLNISDGIVDIQNLMLRFTTDIIGSCAFGIQANSLSIPNNEFSTIHNEQSLGEGNSHFGKFLILCFPNIARLFRLKYMPKYLIKFYTEFVHNIVSIREKLQIRHNDFMDQLMDMQNNDGTKITMKDMASNSLLFFQAGYETSAYTLTFILYELARHIDVQTRARTEIYSILEKCDKILSYDTLTQLKYVEQIIKGKSTLC